MVATLEDTVIEIKEDTVDMVAMTLVNLITIAIHYSTRTTYTILSQVN